MIMAWTLVTGREIPHAMSTLKMNLGKTWFYRCLEPGPGRRRVTVRVATVGWV